MLERTCASQTFAIAFNPVTRRTQNGESSYRADIDGLRAIAVLSVIFMHAGFGLFRSGFLGVDIFFVISGYLVHRLITDRLRGGGFSLFDFYGRRLRRTLPALYLVVATTLAVGTFILMPGDLDALARSAIAASLSMSNILFATQAGYFDHDAITKPLLHTWSLGVEEQYYLLAPLISFALCGLSQPARRIALVSLFAASFIVCVVLQSLFPDVTFFLMPPRLWEFLMGSLVADGLPKITRRWMAEAASALALSLLLISMIGFSEWNPNPGLITLAPCLATAALIHIGASARTAVTRLLSASPLVFCGLISYSLYLWHWPMIVFAGYINLPASPAVLPAGAILLFALSFLSWKFIEQRFRDPASPLRWHAAPILVAGISALAASSSVIIAARGFPARFPSNIAAIASYYDYVNRRDFREGTCFISSKYARADVFDRKACLAASATKPNYLLIGDSHAAHLWPGLSKVFPNIHILQATASGCKPTLATHGLRYCTDLMHSMLVDFLPSAGIDGVIFSAAWKETDVAPLKETVDYAKKWVPNVIVVGNIPTYDFALSDLLSRSLAENRPDLVTQSRSRYPALVDGLLKAAIDPHNYVSLIDLLCPGSHCLVYASDRAPLQFDHSHLTTEGSILLAHKFAELRLFAPLVEGAERQALK